MDINPKTIRKLYRFTIGVRQRLITRQQHRVFVRRRGVRCVGSVPEDVICARYSNYLSTRNRWRRNAAQYLMSAGLA